MHSTANIGQTVNLHCHYPTAIFWKWLTALQWQMVISVI